MQQNSSVGRGLKVTLLQEEKGSERENIFLLLLPLNNILRNTITSLPKNEIRRLIKLSYTDLISIFSSNQKISQKANKSIR